MAMRSFLLLSMTLSLALGLQLHLPLSSQRPICTNTELLQSLSDDFDVSRRSALLTTTAIAAVTLGSPPEALAASALALKLQSLETENSEQVNSNGAPEKHLPQVTVSNNKVQVVVPHVMDPEKPHFIEYIWLKDTMSNKVIASKAFKATDPSPPTLKATVTKGTTIKPLLFCNLHGLWEGQVLTV